MAERGGAGSLGVPSDVEQFKAMSADVVREVEEAQRQLTKELLSRLLALEADCQAVRANCMRLSKELDKERTDRIQAILEIAEKPSRSGVNAERDTDQSVSQVGDSSPRASDTAQRAALAACLGEIDAELRLELDKRMKKVMADVRKEVADRIGALEAVLQEETSSGGGNSSQVTEKDRLSLEGLEVRLRHLEASRLDLRLGALESAAHHSAVFNTAAAGSQPLPEAAKASAAATAAAAA